MGTEVGTDFNQLNQLLKYINYVCSHCSHQKHNPHVEEKNIAALESVFFFSL